VTSLLVGHLLALGLLALDCAARVLRIQVAVLAAGGRLSFGDAFRLNLYGEAAAQVTPNRLGAEPARFFGLAEAGIRPVMALVAIGVEVAAEWPTFLLVAIVLAVHFVPDWGAAAGAWIDRHGAADLLAVQAVILAVLVVIYLLQRFARPGMIRHRVRRQWRVALAHVRRAPWWVLFVGAACTALSFGARALILPALAYGHATGDAAMPSFTMMFYGSLALLHLVLLVPLPSGGGGVEVAFLSGFAGDFGPGHQILMLLLWRFYTGILLAVLGGYVLVRRNGGRAARELLAVGWFKKRRTQT
jgi:uncharacterized membrane protein YbhN (UPF0104 family)